MIVLYVLFFIVLLYFIYLVIIIFLPVLNIKKQPFKKELIRVAPPINRGDISFLVDGDLVRGWYYDSGTIGSNSCIVMSHGFNGTKDCLLENYALEFNKIGIDVITYDYRTYGDSEGLPRQLLSVTKQHDDLRGAIKFVREVKGSKVFLWGTSAGANYGLIVAAEDEDINGVICQCGSYDHKLDEKKGIADNGMFFYISFLPHGIRAKWRYKLGLSPYVVPAYGRSGTKAFLRSDSIFEGAEKIGLNSKNFINEVNAYFMLQPHGPDLLEVAGSIKCPVLFLNCEKDEIIAPESHLKICDILGDKSKVINFPIGHFDIYYGDWFNKSINEQKLFLSEL
ncbi:MAG: alpha/beta hydrolase [Spirochaetaceae bacterium]